jgi:peptidoglycan hydrolase-like protein with peptidoglycan-binding domain
VESRGSGDYRAIGPLTRSGDRAYGRYQVMGANIPSWTQQALGYQITPQQFLADQSVQDKVFDTVFGGYLGRGSPQDAISRWFTGQPLAVGKYRADVNRMTGQRYVDKVMANLGQSAGGSISRRGAEIAALQKNLNSLGANLKVDGLEGPRTRAAMQQFMGSPTSVRTPSFTAPRAASAGVSTPRTPYYNNPYRSSTGGANAIVAPRQVPTSSIKGSPLPGAQLPSYGSNIAYPSAIQPGARAVSTTAVPVTGRAPLGNVWGGFDRPAIKTPAYQNPYTMGTGGANAIVQPAQTARMPQARPPGLQWSQLQQALPAATLMQQLHDQMRRDAAVASQGSRSGMGYSGGGYTGGSYGGYGGGSITSGVGGAFKNR